MNTELQDAFIDQPPGERLMPYSMKTAILVSRAMQRAGETSDSMAIAAYVCVSRGKLRPTIEELEQAFLELDDSEIDAIAAYLERVVTRREQARVELPETPGKP